jgi:hypothetical protein
MNPLCAKNLKTNYNVMPYGNHCTERVNVSHFNSNKRALRENMSNTMHSYYAMT